MAIFQPLTSSFSASAVPPLDISGALVIAGLFLHDISYVGSALMVNTFNIDFVAGEVDWASAADGDAVDRWYNQGAGRFDASLSSIKINTVDKNIYGST